jgi:F-type H+-transporting ATPase subunit epsilon
MTVEIITPEKKVYSGEATAVILPGAAGSFEILNNHAPIISALKQGVIRLENNNEKLSFKTTGGFVEVLHNHVALLVESAQ